MKKLADDAVAQVSEESFFDQPSVGDNSLALLYKHMAGNLRSRWTDFLTTDGEKPDRNRDDACTIRATDSFADLIANWHRAWETLFTTLSALESGDLSRTVTIRGEGLSVLQAITRQLTHYAYHVGQIVYLAKRFAGPEWKSLSIPLGKSADFSRKPDRYL